jgi:hypothetical protein
MRVDPLVPRAEKMTLVLGQGTADYYLVRGQYYPHTVTSGERAIAALRPEA